MNVTQKWNIWDSIFVHHCDRAFPRHSEKCQLRMCICWLPGEGYKPYCSPTCRCPRIMYSFKGKWVALKGVIATFLATLSVVCVCCTEVICVILWFYFFTLIENLLIFQAEHYTIGKWYWTSEIKVKRQTSKRPIYLWHNKRGETDIGLPILMRGKKMHFKSLGYHSF